MYTCKATVQCQLHVNALNHDLISLDMLAGLLTTSRLAARSFLNISKLGGHADIGNAVDGLAWLTVPTHWCINVSIHMQRDLPQHPLPITTDGCGRCAIESYAIVITAS
jgi:hypothetical protein